MGDWLPNYDFWLTSEPEPKGDSYDEALEREDAILDRAGL